MRFLLCPPTHFGVEYVINLWMDGNVGRARADVARRQWLVLHEALAARAEVSLMEPAPGLPDMPFTANGGLVAGGVFVPARFYYPQREPEVAHHREWFRAAGFRVAELPGAGAFEGEGDALFHHDQPLLWAGYGVRSSLETHRDLAGIFGVEVVSLRLVDRRFYHLDTCFAPLPGGRVLYYPPAFDEPSLAAIRARVAPADRFEVDDEDALRFACNAVVLPDAVILNHAGDALRSRLAGWGLETVVCPLTEFMLAGGAAKCLSLKLDQETPPLAGAAVSLVCERVVEVSGHLLDTGLLSRVFDVVADTGGSFTIEGLRAGPRPDMVSFARIRVFAPSPERLEELARHLEQLGAKVQEAAN